MYPAASRVGVAVNVLPRLPCGRVLTSHALLIVRGTEPGKGMWTFPGGRQNLGETVAACAAREAAEELSVGGALQLALPPETPSATTSDAIFTDADGRVSYHYTIAHVPCLLPVELNKSGLAVLPPVAALDDAHEAAWVDISEGGSRGGEEDACRSLVSLASSGALVPFTIPVAASVVTRIKATFPCVEGRAVMRSGAGAVLVALQ